VEATFLFLLGFSVAAVGVIPPGLLNISAAKISVTVGYQRSVSFSIGVCLVVLVQTLVALLFSRYISEHPEVVSVLKLVAVVIFVLVGIYYGFIARPKSTELSTVDMSSKKSYLFQGMFLSAINFLPIPYQAYMALTFSSWDWFHFDAYENGLYIAGATMGTFSTLYVYIFFFDSLKHLRMLSPQNMNYIIGLVSGLIALITFYSSFTS
jgi:threonine/homoserine/homoserine lactone efflux protein